MHKMQHYRNIRVSKREGESETERQRKLQWYWHTKKKNYIQNVFKHSPSSTYMGGTCLWVKWNWRKQRKIQTQYRPNAVSQVQGFHQTRKFDGRIISIKLELAWRKRSGINSLIWPYHIRIDCTHTHDHTNMCMRINIGLNNIVWNCARTRLRWSTSNVGFPSIIIIVSNALRECYVLRIVPRLLRRSDYSVRITVREK